MPFCVAAASDWSSETLLRSTGIRVFCLLRWPHLREKRACTGASVATIPAPSLQGSPRRVGVLPSRGCRRGHQYYDPVRRLARPTRLGCRLGCVVAGATRTARGLPCSACSCRRVPSLLPRESASVPAQSVFPRRTAFAGLRAARPLHSVTGLPLSSLHATARAFATADSPAGNILVPLLPDASRHHAGDRATLLLCRYRGGLLSAHEEHAACTAHRNPRTTPSAPSV
jgi:hypothetical protein